MINGSFKTYKEYMYEFSKLLRGKPEQKTIQEVLDEHISFLE
jgi:hypothetical protein